MKTEKIKIIKLDAKDWEKFKNIRLETLKEEAGAFNSTFDESVNYPDSYWQGKLVDNNEIHLFGEFENKIIGTINATIKEEDAEEGTAVIHGMYLNKSYRGLGAGKLLLNNLIDGIKVHKEINKIKLWVKKSQISAIKLYESVGFRFVEMAGEKTMILEKV